MSDVQSRDAQLTAAFVKLAASLTDDYDVVDLLDTLVRECVALLDVDAGGLMIADPSSQHLELVVCTSEKVGFVGVTPPDGGDGPYIECFTSGEPVSVANIETEADRWPFFRAGALAGGFRSIQVVPLRHRGTVIGAMNLFSTTTGRLSEQHVTVARGLAAVATIGILQERNIRDSTVLTEQLQVALDSRVVIEQAKGIIAQSANIGVDEAFTVLRAYCRQNGFRLRDVAIEVANRTLDLPLRSRA